MGKANGRVSEDSDNGGSGRMEWVCKNLVVRIGLLMQKQKQSKKKKASLGLRSKRDGVPR